jgi:hypothetical protein
VLLLTEKLTFDGVIALIRQEAGLTPSTLKTGPTMATSNSNPKPEAQAFAA